MSEVKQSEGETECGQQSPQVAQQPTLVQQQSVDGQPIQVQISHNEPNQLHSQSSQVINLQNPSILAPMPSHGTATTYTTMSAAPAQQMVDWTGQGRVQVIQQPLQNPTYIQPIYNAQGQLLVPGNISLHPGNVNQPIQVIAAGKPFQAGQMPQMLTTTQGKPLVQGQTTSFPGYATVPTSGNNQTLLISQLGVLGQTNVVPQQQGKHPELQKLLAKTGAPSNNMKHITSQQQNISLSNLVSSQPQGITTQAPAIIQPQIISPIQYTCNPQQQRVVPQGSTQAMQFAPWQGTFQQPGFPQGLTWTPGAIQSSALLTQGSPILIRNPQQEQAGMFIQNAQPSTVQQHSQMTPQFVNKPNQEVGGNVQNKGPTTKTFSTILPNSSGSHNVRPGSSVSTQTVHALTAMNQGVTAYKFGPRIRAKSGSRMPSAATTPKSEALNQSKSQIMQARVIKNPNLTGPAPSQIISPDKFIRPNPFLVNRQPVLHIQNVQNAVQDQNNQKNQNGQITVSTGKPPLRNSGTMPVALAPGQLAPSVVNLFIHTAPRFSSSTSGNFLISNQAVQNVQTIREPSQKPASVTLPATVKRETPTKRTTVPENRKTETEIERPNDSSTNRIPHITYSEPTVPGEEKLDGNDFSTSEERISDDSETEEKELKIDLKSPHTQTKATVVVKPQILTHVVDGFIIQESSEPFPIRGSMDGIQRRMPVSFGDSFGKRPCLLQARTEQNREEQAQAVEVRAEETRTEQSHAEQELGEDRALGQEGDGENLPQQTQNNDNNTGNVVVDNTARNENNTSNADGDDDANNPRNWSVAQVCDFIRNLPGCSSYVDEFAVQEIDGESLLLLKPELLTTAMSLKLGPAVKIINKVDKIRPTYENSGNP